MIRGALAAALTPLRDGGAALDNDAFGPYVDFLAAGGLDGILALGTTGEGILLSAAERKRAAELFVAAARGRLQVAVHCGAQTTADTVALASHASGIAGLDVFIGAEELVERGLAKGAAGSVSGLAAAFPEGADPSKRVFLEARFPFHAALKTVIALRGVPMRQDVRPPLRGLTPDERAEVE